MKYIGAHVPALPTIVSAPAEAAALGASAFAFNLWDPGKYNAPACTPEVADSFRAQCREYGFTAAQILPHSAFVINLASPDARKLALSRKAFTAELQRCRDLGITMLNFHPGAHLKALGEDEALARVAESLNRCLDAVPDVCAVIENTAGQGTYLGYSFEHLAQIISRVEDKSRVGVCIDTCHATAAGYDMLTADGYRATWELFDHTVGFQYLRAMHLNDAARPVGSRVDRHAPIAQGTLGEPFFRMLMQDPRMNGIPMILETPDPALWAAEIQMLRQMSQL